MVWVSFAVCYVKGSVVVVVFGEGYVWLCVGYVVFMCFGAFLCESKYKFWLMLCESMR